MKKAFKTILILLATVSCVKETADQVEPDGPFYAYAEVSLPVGVSGVYVTYGSKDSTKEIKMPVNVVPEAPADGRDVEPFGKVKFLFKSNVQTLVSVQYKVFELTKATGDDAKTVLENLPVTDQYGTIISDYAPADATLVELPEPAPYKTVDGDFTMYHSSGVVMFEDSWPNLNNGINDEDFNDIVIDYDIEAVTVADAQLESKGWKEQVKVAIHVRTVGTGEAWRVGLILENFDMHNVAKVTEYKTLDSFNSGHGTLPSWTIGTIQENSLHYDPLATEYATTVWDRPAIEIGGLQRYNETNRGAGTETYIYQNNEGPVEHVMNPALKQYAAWNGPHTEQYDPTLADDKTLPRSLDYIQKQVYYNVVPGYVNVAGGLYTYTVVYEMKSRADMTEEERLAVKKNMIDAVVNTTAQNFYIVRKDYTPVGLKGYKPVDFSTKNNSNYLTKYNQQFNANADHLSADTYYKGINGEVWGFKCPTLTKHLWNKMPFAWAYPNYKKWVESNGATNADWYKDADVNGRYLTCWW